jgi:hypothetical protein
MSTIERERRRRRIGENCEGDKSTITWGIEVYMVVLALKLESWGESGRIGGGREREKCYIHVSTICDLVFSIASDHASINFHFFCFHCQFRGSIFLLFLSFSIAIRLLFERV